MKRFLFPAAMVAALLLTSLANGGEVSCCGGETKVNRLPPTRTYARRVLVTEEKTFDENANATDNDTPTPPANTQATPLPPTMSSTTEYAEACDCDHCCRERAGLLRNLGRELVQRPVYAVQKARLNAEHRRLERREEALAEETCELLNEGSKLSAQSASDCVPEHKTMKAQAKLANGFRDNAVERTQLQADQFEHSVKAAKLREKADRLFSEPCDNN